MRHPDPDDLALLALGERLDPPINEHLANSSGPTLRARVKRGRFRFLPDLVGRCAIACSILLRRCDVR